MKQNYLLPDLPIAFNRDFVRIGCGIKGALMLSQAVYWSKRTKNEEGWFYKTQEEWERETGMTPDEQKTANRRLKTLGFMEVEKRGMPARNYYRVVVNAVIEEMSVGGKATHQWGEKPPTSEGKSHPHSITEITTENTTEMVAEATSEELEYTDPPKETFDTKRKTYAKKGINYVPKKKTNAQEKSIMALSTISYYRQKMQEEHPEHVIVTNKERDRKLKKLCVDNMNHLGYDLNKAKELVTWWIEGAGEWAEYAPENCFSITGIEKYLNKDKPKNGKKGGEIFE